MPLPKKDYRGQKASITMMEFRKQPGETVDCASSGMTVRITKSGKHVASMIPADAEGCTTTIGVDGSIRGPIPLTFRCNLGNGGYGN